MLIGRGAAAQKAESRSSSGRNLVPRAGWDEDGIAGGDFAGFAIDFHQAGAFQQEVEFLTPLVIMPLGAGPRRQGGLCEGLELDRGIGAVENAADGGTILGGEGSLGTQILDGH